MRKFHVRLTLRLALGLTVAFAFGVAPALAQAQAPGSLAQLDSPNSCIAGSDNSEECSTENDGLNGSEDVAVSPDGSDVYVIGNDDDAIAEFQRNGDGSLTPLDTSCIADSGASESSCTNTIATGLDRPVAIAISPDGQNVYVAAQDSHGIGTIAEFARDSGSGELTQLSPNDCIAENTSETDGQTSDCANQTGHGIEAPVALAVTPDGQNVYVASEEGSSLAEFARNGNGSLSQLNGANDCVTEQDDDNSDCGTTGSGLTSVDAVAISSDADNVYTGGDSNPGAIAEFQRNGDGSLTQLASPNNCIQESADSSECGSETGAGMNEITALTVSPDGQNLYSTAAGEEGAIAEFARNGDGSLTQLDSPNDCIQESDDSSECGTESGTGLDGAAEVAVSPDGLDVYVATNSDDCCDSDIAEFARSTDDGSLTQLASPDSCIGEDSGECDDNDNATGLGGGALAVSGDGANVYATGFDAVSEFDRAPAEQTLTVSLTGTGSGNVSDGTGAISCPDACSAEYPTDTQVTLTATSSAGSTFTGWSGGSCEGTGPCQVTVSSDTEVTATFTANPPPSQATLTVSPAGTGSGTVSDGTGGISCPSTCSHAYATNTQVTLTETPASGSTFAGWSGACSGTGACQLTMSADMQVTATFTTAGPPAPGAPTPVLTSPPATVTDAGAAFQGTVDPGGLATTAYFQYGLDKRYTPGGGAGPDYTDQTQAQSVGSDFSTHGVGPVSVAGLVPNALYHVRLVATNSAGTTFGQDVTFTTAAAPVPASPTLGLTFNIAPVSGLVFVYINGQLVPLTELTQIGANTVLDTRHGTVQLITSSGAGGAARDAAAKKRTQVGDFGGAVFKVHQTRSGKNKGLATIMLTESAFKGAPSQSICKTAGSGDAHAAKVNSKVIQLLHASAHGKFKTSGRYSAATVLGTIWTVTARCDGTLTHAIKDPVEVTDFVRHKTIILHAGQSYLAPGPKKHK